MTNNGPKQETFDIKKLLNIDGVYVSVENPNFFIVSFSGKCIFIAQKNGCVSQFEPVNIAAWGHVLFVKAQAPLQLTFEN